MIQYCCHEQSHSFCSSIHLYVQTTPVCYINIQTYLHSDVSINFYESILSRQMSEYECNFSFL